MRISDWSSDVCSSDLGGGLEDGPLVVRQDLEPGGYIGSVILADLRRNAEVGAEIGGPDLGDQLLAGIAFVAPALAPQVAVEPGRVARPMCEFMSQGRRVALRVAEGLGRRHLDVIGLDRVISPVAAVANLGAGVGEEGVGLLDPRDRARRLLGAGIIRSEEHTSELQSLIRNSY